MRVGTDMTDNNDREIEREEVLLQLDGMADERYDLMKFWLIYT